MNWDIRQKHIQYLKSNFQKKKKNSASSPPIIYFLFFVENNKIEKQQGHAYGKGNNI